MECHGLLAAGPLASENTVTSPICQPREAILRKVMLSSILLCKSYAVTDVTRSYGQAFMATYDPQDYFAIWLYDLIERLECQFPSYSSIARCSCHRNLGYLSAQPYPQRIVPRPI